MPRNRWLRLTSGWYASRLVRGRERRASHTVNSGKCVLRPRGYELALGCTGESDPSESSECCVRIFLNAWREVRDTAFFERADLMDTRMGQSEHKDSPADVARIGFDAMMKGDSHVVAGLKNKLQVAMAHVTPVDMLAEMHRKQAEPGSGKRH